MSWFDAVPAALASIAWLLLPGLPSTYALGLRGLAAWAMAPVVGVAVLGVTAIIAGSLGIAWSVGLAVGVCVAAAGVVGAVAFLVRRRVPVVREGDPRGLTITAAASLLPALVLGTITIIRGFGRPDSISQTYDALFHYNTIALIGDTRNGSSLTVSSFGADTPSSFYPAAWHDITSLVVTTSGTSIPGAANLVSAAVAIVLWPLAALFLTRQIFGRSRAALAVAGALSAAFVAGPWGLLGFGVLWPNALGLATIPVGLAVILSLTGLAKDDALGRGRAALLLPVVAIGATLAHPGALFSLIALGVFPLGHGLLRRVMRLRRAGQTWRGLGEVAAVLAVFGAAWYWTATTQNPAFRSVREQYWAPFETPLQAVREVLLNGTNGWAALWLLSAVVLIGLITSLWVTERRWLVPAHLLTGVLYLMTAAMNRPETRKFTGYWYNDSFRLAAVLPVTAVPLAVAGILFIAKLIADRIPARTADRPAWIRPAWIRLAGSMTAVSVALVAVLAIFTNGLYQPERTQRIAVHYQDVSPGNVLTYPGQRDFLLRVKADIPDGSVVANNPWDGTGILWALADRRTLFPHFTMSASPDQRYLAEHLSEAAGNPQVCGVANRLHVDYLIVGDNLFWPWDERRLDYPGLADPASKSGFQLVATDGYRKLYRITACASGQSTS